MALLVLGKTVCPVCGKTVDVGNEVVSLPVLTSTTRFSDASVHRSCMHDLPDTVRRAWWEWWTQLAQRQGARARDGVLAYKGRRSFSVVLREEFVVLEEELSQLRSLMAFLSSPSPSNAPSHGWLTYRAEELRIIIENPLTKMTVFKGLLSEARRADAVNALARLVV